MTNIELVRLQMKFNIELKPMIWKMLINGEIKLVGSIIRK